VWQHARCDIKVPTSILRVENGSSGSPETSVLYLPVYMASRPKRPFSSIAFCFTF